MPIVSASNSKTQNQLPLARAVFDQSGKNISPPLNGEVKKFSEHADRYYMKWNKIPFGANRGFGVGAVIALFEIFIGGALALIERSPAPITNFLTSVSENAQVFIAGYESKSGKKADEKKLKHAMEACVATSGVLGLYLWCKEINGMVKGESHEVHDLPSWQKWGLTLGSLGSAAMMGIGYLEKSLMATLAAKNGGKKAGQIIINARSDLRCAIEWLAMVIYLWVKEFKPAKIAIDLLLPGAAIQDGFSHLVGDLLEEKHHSTCEHSHDKHDHKNEPEGFWIKLSKKLVHSHGHGQDKISVPSFYYNKFFLGNQNVKGVTDAEIRIRVLPPDRTIARRSNTGKANL